MRPMVWKFQKCLFMRVSRDCSVVAVARFVFWVKFAGHGEAVLMPAGYARIFP